MKHVTQLISQLTERLTKLAKDNATVAKKVEVGNRAIIPLCEVSMGFGGGGGAGEGAEGDSEASGSGTGGGAGGGTKVMPVAVIVVDDGKVRIEKLGL